MSLLRIDHTAVVVRDMDEALQRYQRIFGLVPCHQTSLPREGVDVAFLAIGDSQIELIHPTDSRSGVSRFLERHGESLHHLAIAVDDIRAELQRLQEAGVELIDREPRRGVHGQIAFVHPRGTGGLLVELVEHDRIASSDDTV